MPERSSPTEKKTPPRVKLTDPRLRPFLIFGLFLGVINSIPTQTIAFYFMDRLGFSTEMTPQLVGVGLMGGAMASLFAQLVIVQRLRLSPRALMRTAPVLFVLGHLLMWSLPQLGTVIFGMVLAGFGMGLAMPGYNAAASLAVNSDEQGASIGLAGAAGASGFIVSPIIGFSLYGLAPQAPYIFTMMLAAGLWVFAMTSHRIGTATPEIEPQALPEKPASAPYQ